MKVLSSFIITLVFALPGLAEGPYLATGIKIGEVTQTDVRVWVRLTQDAQRVSSDVPMPSVKYFDVDTGEPIVGVRRPRQGRPEITYPEGLDVSSIHGAVPGARGVARVLCCCASALCCRLTT